jgi:hypothetical protein
MTIENAWDMLVEYGIATEDELQLVTSLIGYRIEVLADVLYARTGYNDLEQFKEDYENGNY